MNIYTKTGLYCIIISFCIILHHWLIHEPNGQKPLNGLDRFFQISDIGNFKSFNHETFAIMFFVFGIVFLLLSRRI